MSNFCAVTLCGRIGREPELKYTPQGTPFLKFPLAVDTGWSDRKVTSWYEITHWGKRGESLIKWLEKGQAVICHGELSIRVWESQQGTKGTTVAVEAREIVMLGKGKPSREGQSSAGPDEPTSSPPAEASPDGDVPF